MSVKCEDELKQVFEETSLRLAGSAYELSSSRTSDYLMKCSLSRDGNAVGTVLLDYSPRKQAHAFRKGADLSDAEFGVFLQIISRVPAQGKTAAGLTGRPAGGTAGGSAVRPAGGTAGNSSVRPTGGSSSSPAGESPAKASKTGARKNAAAGKSSTFRMKPEAERIPVHAWVDGSYLQGRVGYGAVVLQDGEVVAELFGEVTDPVAIQSRQVGGELRAVMEAVRWCRRNGVQEMAVFFDFLNLEKWAIGAYKTNNDMTKAYKAYMDRSPVRIVWNKVESHTGVEWNDYADRLAKRGAAGETGE